MFVYVSSNKICRLLFVLCSVKYKEAGFGRSAVYGSMDEKMLKITGIYELLPYCINYILCQKN
jgi:hypothetical protein